MTGGAPTPCPLCGETRQTLHLERNGYRIVRCDRCGFLFVSPPPGADELAAFYQQSGYYEGSDFGYADYLGEQARHEELARRRLRRIEHLVPAKGRLLDVGCAAGFFLAEAQRRGWEPLGVELSREMAAQAERRIGRPIAPTIDDLNLPPESLDAVTLWEYIEHVPDPRAQIATLAALLRPGGVLALSTPNTGYWTAVRDPARWREFKPPAHLGFFTAATLRRMLETCGLEIVALPGTTPRAPSQPYAARRLLERLRERVGSGADRRTPLWPAFGLAWRAVELGSRAGYRLRRPGGELTIGLEAYARKR